MKQWIEKIGVGIVTALALAGHGVLSPGLRLTFYSGLTVASSALLGIAVAALVVVVASPSNENRLRFNRILVGIWLSLYWTRLA